MKERQNIFQLSDEKRQKNQNQIKKVIGMKTELTSVDKVPMNISLPSDVKYQLKTYAMRHNTNVSSLIQKWLQEALEEES